MDPSQKKPAKLPKDNLRLAPSVHLLSITLTQLDRHIM